MNQFLTSINNEVSAYLNTTYASNLASLTNLVLVLFAQDKTVIPKESAWFGSYEPSNDSNSGTTLVPMHLQPLYTEDRIGLRSLDERDAVILEICEGEHMQLAKGCWEPLVRRFVGGTVDAVDPTNPEHILRLQA